MKTIFNGLVVINLSLGLICLSGDVTDGTLLAHHHKTKRDNYNVVEVDGVKYESYDAKGNKVSSGSLKFTTKYLDTNDSLYS